MTDRIIDLDAGRKARAEVDPGLAPKIRFGGRDFALPTEMPFDFADKAARGQIGDAVRSLLGDQADDFFAFQPTIKDVEALAEGVGRLYGVDSGKSEASSDS